MKASPISFGNNKPKYWKWPFSEIPFSKQLSAYNVLNLVKYPILLISPVGQRVSKKNVPFVIYLQPV